MEEGTIFKAVCGHENRGCFEHSLLQKGVVQIRPYNRLGHRFRGVVFLGEPYNSVDLAQFSR
jgi:hypothetical protein